MRDISYKKADRFSFIMNNLYILFSFSVCPCPSIYSVCLSLSPTLPLSFALSFYLTLSASLFRPPPPLSLHFTLTPPPPLSPSLSLPYRSPLLECHQPGRKGGMTYSTHNGVASSPHRIIAVTPQSLPPLVGPFSPDCHPPSLPPTSTTPPQTHNTSS